MTRMNANAAWAFSLCLVLATSRLARFVLADEESPSLTPKQLFTGELSSEKDVWTLTVDIPSPQIQCATKHVTATFMMDEGSDVGAVKNVSRSLKQSAALAFFGNEEVFEVVIPPKSNPDIQCNVDPTASLTAFVVCNDCKKIKGAVRFAFGRPFGAIPPSPLSSSTKATGPVSTRRFSAVLHADVLTRKRGSRFTAVFQFPATESGEFWVDAVRPQTFHTYQPTWYKEDKGKFSLVYTTLKVPKVSNGKASLDVVIDVLCRTCPESEAVLTYAPQFPEWTNIKAKKLWNDLYARQPHATVELEKQRTVDHENGSRSFKYRTSAVNFCSTTLNGGFSFNIQPRTTTAKAYWRLNGAGKYAAEMGVNGSARIAAWPSEARDTACSHTNPTLSLHVTCHGCTISDMVEFAPSEPNIPAYVSAAHDVQCFKQWKDNSCRISIKQSEELIAPHCWFYGKSQCKDNIFTGGIKPLLMHQFGRQWEDKRLDTTKNLDWSLSGLSQCLCDELQCGAYRYLEADEAVLGKGNVRRQPAIGNKARGVVTTTDRIPKDGNGVENQKNKNESRSPQNTPAPAQKTIPDLVTDEGASLVEDEKTQNSLSVTQLPIVRDHTRVPTKTDKVTAKGGGNTSKAPNYSIATATSSSKAMETEENSEPPQKTLKSNNATTSTTASFNTEGTTTAFESSVETASTKKTVGRVAIELTFKDVRDKTGIENNARGAVAMTDRLLDDEANVKSERNQNEAGTPQNTPAVPQITNPDLVTDEGASLPEEEKTQTSSSVTHLPMVRDHTRVPTKTDNVTTKGAETTGKAPTHSIATATSSSKAMETEENSEPPQTTLRSNNATTSTTKNFNSKVTSTEQAVEEVKTQLAPDNESVLVKMDFTTQDSSAELDFSRGTTSTHLETNTDAPSTQNATMRKPEIISNTGAISTKIVDSAETQSKSTTESTSASQGVVSHQTKALSVNNTILLMEVVNAGVKGVAKEDTTSLEDAANDNKDDNEIKGVPSDLLALFPNTSVGTQTQTSMEFDNWVPEEEISQNKPFLTSFCFFKEKLDITSVYLSDKNLLTPVFASETRFPCYSFGSCDLWEISSRCRSEKCNKPKITVTGEILPPRLRWRIDRAIDLGQFPPVGHHTAISRAGWYGTLDQVLKYNVSDDVTQLRVETTPFPQCLPNVVANPPRGVRGSSNKFEKETLGLAASPVTSFVYIRYKVELHPTKTLLFSSDPNNYRLTGLISAIVLATVAACCRGPNLR